MSDIDANIQMRDFIVLTESLVNIEYPPETVEPLVEDVIALPVAQDNRLSDRLVEMVEKLRNHTENDTSDYGLGVEIGLQRAADMLENLIRSTGE